jgi:hypothetical protein
MVSVIFLKSNKIKKSNNNIKYKYKRSARPCGALLRRDAPPDDNPFPLIQLFSLTFNKTGVLASL